MDNLSKEQRTFCMSKIRGKDTKPEMAARHVLIKMGLRYRIGSIVINYTENRISSFLN